MERGKRTGFCPVWLGFAVLFTASSKVVCNNTAKNNSSRTELETFPSTVISPSFHTIGKINGTIYLVDQNADHIMYLKAMSLQILSSLGEFVDGTNIKGTDLSTFFITSKSKWRIDVAPQASQETTTYSHITSDNVEELLTVTSILQTRSSIVTLILASPSHHSMVVSSIYVGNSNLDINSQASPGLPSQRTSFKIRINKTVNTDSVTTLTSGEVLDQSQRSPIYSKNGSHIYAQSKSQNRTSIKTPAIFSWIFSKVQVQTKDKNWVDTWKFPSYSRSSRMDSHEIESLRKTPLRTNTYFTMHPSNIAAPKSMSLKNSVIVSSIGDWQRTPNGYDLLSSIFPTTVLLTSSAIDIVSLQSHSDFLQRKSTIGTRTHTNDKSSRYQASNSDLHVVTPNSVIYQSQTQVTVRNTKDKRSSIASNIEATQAVIQPRQSYKTYETTILYTVNTGYVSKSRSSSTVTKSNHSDNILETLQPRPTPLLGSTNVKESSNTLTPPISSRSRLESSMHHTERVWSTVYLETISSMPSAGVGIIAASPKSRSSTDKKSEQALKVSASSSQSTGTTVFSTSTNDGFSSSSNSNQKLESSTLSPRSTDSVLVATPITVFSSSGDSEQTLESSTSSPKPTDSMFITTPNTVSFSNSISEPLLIESNTSSPQSTYISAISGPNTVFHSSSYLEQTLERSTSSLRATQGKVISTPNLVFSLSKDSERTPGSNTSSPQPKFTLNGSSLLLHSTDGKVLSTPENILPPFSSRPVYTPKTNQSSKWSRDNALETSGTHMLSTQTDKAHTSLKSSLKSKTDETFLLNRTPIISKSTTTTSQSNFISVVNTQNVAENDSKRETNIVVHSTSMQSLCSHVSQTTQEISTLRISLNEVFSNAGDYSLTQSIKFAFSTPITFYQKTTTAIVQTQHPNHSLSASLGLRSTNTDDVTANSREKVLQTSSSKPMASVFGTLNPNETTKSAFSIMSRSNLVAVTSFVTIRVESKHSTSKNEMDASLVSNAGVSSLLTVTTEVSTQHKIMFPNTSVNRIQGSVSRSNRLLTNTIIHTTSPVTAGENPTRLNTTITKNTAQISSITSSHNQHKMHFCDSSEGKRCVCFEGVQEESRTRGVSPCSQLLTENERRSVVAIELDTQTELEILENRTKEVISAMVTQFCNNGTYQCAPTSTRNSRSSPDKAFWNTPTTSRALHVQTSKSSTGSISKNGSKTTKNSVSPAFTQTICHNSTQLTMTSKNFENPQTLANGHVSSKIEPARTHSGTTANPSVKAKKRRKRSLHALEFPLIRVTARDVILVETRPIKSTQPTIVAFLVKYRVVNDSGNSSTLEAETLRSILTNNKRLLERRMNASIRAIGFWIKELSPTKTVWRTTTTNVVFPTSPLTSSFSGSPPTDSPPPVGSDGDSKIIIVAIAVGVTFVLILLIIIAIFLARMNSKWQGEFIPGNSANGSITPDYNTQEMIAAAVDPAPRITDVPYKSPKAKKTTKIYLRRPEYVTSQI